MMITKDNILNELHKEYGYCGPCGKKDCAGKSSHSKLPDTIKINTDWLIKILDKLEKEKP